MKRVFHGVVSLAVLTLFNVLALGLHAAALQPVHVGHSAGTSSLQTSSATCLTICTTATLNRDEIIDDTDKDEDDTPQPPFYIQFQDPPLIALVEKHGEEARLATDREPPPGGPPAYIGLTVFRA
jgi:hypothetical protein